MKDHNNLANIIHLLKLTANAPEETLGPKKQNGSFFQPHEFSGEYFALGFRFPVNRGLEKLPNLMQMSVFRRFLLLEEHIVW